MFHTYNGHLWGMHLIWWVIWIILIVWVFATPWDIPGQRNKNDSPLDDLKKRFARGEITKEEFEKGRNIINTN